MNKPEDDISRFLELLDFESLKSFEKLPPKQEDIFLCNLLTKEMVPCTFDGDAYYNKIEHQFIEDLTIYQGWTKRSK